METDFRESQVSNQPLSVEAAVDQASRLSSGLPLGGI
jgi:hypothetical protein